MATPWSVALTTVFFCILLIEVICSSEASVDCTYGSPQVKILSSSVPTEQQNAYLFLKPFHRGCRARQLAVEFVNGVVLPNLQLNVSAVVVTADERQLGALHRTLESVHASLAAAGLDRRVKVSPEMSLPSLRAAMAKKNHRNKREQWRRVMEFVRKSGSFVVVEMGADENGDLAVADVAAAVEDGGVGVGVVFRVNRRDSPMARLIGDAVKGKRSMRVLTETSSASSPSPRRELDDVYAPVTNPTTMPSTTNPVTVPATNPATNPGVVTVPSTNPAAGYSNNPTNLPPLYPEPTPVTMPDPTTTTPASTTPFTSPVTNPTTTPVTNPATTPAVTYPYPQQGGVSVGVGGGVPMTPTPTYQQPAAPATAGMTWCVAKTGLMDSVLQNGLDYACGMGGADCSAIQPMGSCYNPNTMQAHASYAFNAYFQRNPSPTSCDFGGAGMLVNVNPSSGTCMFQTSAGYGVGNSPAVTGTVPVGGVTPVVGGMTPMGPAVGGAGLTPMGPAVGGSGSGSTVLNANSPGAGGNSMYGSGSGTGSDNPTSLTGGAASLSCGWVLCLVWIFTFAYVKEKV